MSQPKKLEVCIDSVRSARAAQQGGASRVELCDNLLVGGTTPSYGMLIQVRQAISIDMHVLIRPRGGDFCYTQDELEVMLRDIAVAREIGAEGVVIGALRPDGQVDSVVAEKLIKAARPMRVTWHRAFDLCRDPRQALQEIMALGCDYLLTSGQQPTAMEGRQLIAELIQQAVGQIVIMPGGGVNAANIAALAQATGASQFHSSGRHTVPSRMQWRRPHIYMGAWQQSEYTHSFVDPQRIQQMVAALA